MPVSAVSIKVSTDYLYMMIKEELGVKEESGEEIRRDYSDEREDLGG
jgi:hypothetical protein